MMALRACCAFVAAIVILAPDCAFAEAWLQRKGDHYLRYSTSVFITEDEFGYDGERQAIFAEAQRRDDTWFRDIAFSVYYEYGVLDRLTFVSFLSNKIVRLEETITFVQGAEPLDFIRTNSGPADLYLWAKAPFTTSGIVSSISIGGKIPLGYDKRPDNDGPPLGTGEPEGEIKLAVGGSLPWWGGLYTTNGVGYRGRKGPLHNEYLVFSEIGTQRGRYFGKLRFDGLKNELDPPDIYGSVVVTPVPAEFANQVVVGDQDIYKLTGQFDVELVRGWWIGGTASNTFYGRNTLAGWQYGFAVTFQP